METSRTGRAELPIRVDDPGFPARDSDPTDTGDERSGLHCWVAYANGIGLGSNAVVADVNIVVTGRKIQAADEPDANIIAPRVVIERLITIRRVVAARYVAIERSITMGRVIAAGCVVVERLPASGRVVAAGCDARKGINALSSSVAVTPVFVLAWGAGRSLRPSRAR